MRLALLFAVTALPAMADVTPAWDDLKPALYGETELLPGDGMIALDVPYRTMTDSRTPFRLTVTALEGIKAVSIILDDNPMPVSARVDLAEPQQTFHFEATLRINGPTPYHVVAETVAGHYYVTEGFLKTSGQGACAAPPGTDPIAALETLGDMELAVGRETDSAVGVLTALAGGQTELTVDVRHPSLSGMQMDQISLLFIPARFIDTLDVRVDGESYATLTGSISLSEDPEFVLSIPGDARDVGVTMTDTDGTVTHAARTLAAY